METLIANDQDKIEVGEALRRMIERVVQAALATAAAYRRDRGETLPDWLAAVLASPLAEISVALVDDPQIHELNREYRNVDCPTDVLSFAGEEAPQTEDEPALLGDVIVSLETAWRQAAEYGHTPEREVGYLVAHGVLHLLGFDHEDEAQREEMRRLEETALAQVDLVREGAPS